MKKKIIILLKFIISFSVLFYYFSRIDLFSYFNLLKKVNFYYFLIALLIYFVALFFYTYKWKLLFKMMDLEYGFLLLLKINLTSMFYAAFLPGGFLAGETVKSYKISKGKNKKAKKVFSIILDRLTGAIAFIIIGAICFLLSNFFTKELFVLYVFLFVGAIIAYIALTAGKVRQKIKSFLLKLFQRYNVNFLDKEKNIKNIFINKAVLLGVAFQLTITAGLFFIILSVGQKINFIDLIWINALVSTVTTLPISILGIGPREISFVYLFGLFGFAQASSLSIATLMVFILILRGIPGGLIEFKEYNK